MREKHLVCTKRRSASEWLKGVKTFQECIRLPCFEICVWWSIAELLHFARCLAAMPISKRRNTGGYWRVWNCVYGLFAEQGKVWKFRINWNNYYMGERELYASVRILRGRSWNRVGKLFFKELPRLNIKVDELELLLLLEVRIGGKTTGWGSHLLLRKGMLSQIFAVVWGGIVDVRQPPDWMRLLQRLTVSDSVMLRFVQPLRQ